MFRYLAEEQKPAGTKSALLGQAVVQVTPHQVLPGQLLAQVTPDEVEPVAVKE